MTKVEAKPAIASVNELFAKRPDGLREIVRAVMQEMLEAEMTDALGAEKGQRTGARRACQEFRVLAGRTSSQAAIAFEKRSANMTAI